jgi:hypothetical protein
MLEKRSMGLKKAILLTLMILMAVASAFAGGNRDSSGAAPEEESSARGAIGRVEAVSSGPMFEGDGGKKIRLAVLAPEAQGTVPEYLPVYVQGLLNNNFK